MGEQEKIFRIDPIGCGCVDCIVKESVPIDRANQNILMQAWLGEIDNASGMVLTPKIEFTYE